jgi:LPS export ABC transporter protein LptC
MRLKKYFIPVICFIVLESCINNAKTMEEMKPYDGPLMEVDSMKTIYTEEAVTKVIVKAPKQLVLQIGDREFPKGVKVDFYEGGEISSTLTSNYARHYKESNKYMVSGNVVINNVKEAKRLNTEELFWMPAEERILVARDKQVIITTKTDVLKGEGLEAKQDFSSYKILKPSGETTLK